MRCGETIARRLGGALFAAPSAFLAFVSAGHAAEGSRFDLSAEIRTRGEADDRTFREADSFRYTIFQRTTLRLDVKGDEGAAGVIEIRDSRAWGDRTDIAYGSHQLELHQGFLRLHPGNFVTVDLGRQELAYGRERVFGDADFDNIGRSFDAARIRTNVADGWWDVLGGKVSRRFYDIGVNGVDESFVGSFLHHEFAAAHLTAEPFVLYRDGSLARLFETAFGGYAKAGAGRLTCEADLVMERGKVSHHGLRAYLAAADLGWDASSDRNGTRGVSIGFTRFTGDDPADRDDAAYDPLYADNHAYFGIMDIADVYANGFRSGLSDYHAKAWAALTERVTLTATGSLFRTRVARELGSAFDGRDLGQEIDLVLGARLVDGVMLEAGGGYFLRGDIFKATLGDQNGTWGYLQASGSF